MALVAGLLWMPPSRADAEQAPAQSPSRPCSLWSMLDDTQYSAIAGNPGAVNGKPGSGLLGRLLGFDSDSGVFLGGVWVANADYQFGGGANPKTWNTNSLEILATDLDLEKLARIPGGEVGAELLQFDGQPANADAGVVTGYDGLTETPPLDRTELYELWWRQRLFDDKLAIRFGKVVPTYDFNNVARPIPVRDQSLAIPAVTGLIYTPIFVNPTILGAMPGYYNSAYGITTTFTPARNWYAMYGVYDGTLATGRQTGISATPRFSGYYFQIGEIGTAWFLGNERLPGSLGLGGWGQTGELTAGSPGKSVHQNGTEGFYTFASQRLWFRHPGLDNSGVTSFAQFGINNSSTMLASKYFGIGLTAFGLVPHRPDDSFGVGSAWSWLNHLPGSGFRSNEEILEAYYQVHVFGGFFVQPTFSYIPNPGANTSYRGATVFTLQSTILF